MSNYHLFLSLVPRSSHRKICHRRSGRDRHQCRVSSARGRSKAALTVLIHVQITCEDWQRLPVLHFLVSPIAEKHIMALVSMSMSRCTPTLLQPKEVTRSFTKIPLSQGRVSAKPAPLPPLLDSLAVVMHLQQRRLTISVTTVALPALPRV